MQNLLAYYARARGLAQPAYFLGRSAGGDSAISVAPGSSPADLARTFTEAAAGGFACFTVPAPWPTATPMHRSCSRLVARWIFSRRRGLY